MATLYSYFYHVKQHIHSAISFSYVAINLSLVLEQRFVSSPPKFTFFKSYHYQCQAAIYLARYGWFYCNYWFTVWFSYLSEPWLLTLPGSRGGPGPRCARAWGPQGAASFPAAAGSWHPLPPIRGPSRRSPALPACPWCPSTWSCPPVGLRSLRSIRTSVALEFRKTHQSRHSTCISSDFGSKYVYFSFCILFLLSR